MAYLLDTNVFITAKDSHYGMDFCPAFWDWLARKHASGLLFSVEQVRSELLEGDDELRDWVMRLVPGFFLSTENASERSVQAIDDWVHEKKYENQVMKKFFNEGADYPLILQAYIDRSIVVTHETSQPNRRNRIKIPDVCVGVGVEYINPFEMLRRERARFVLP